MGAGETKRVMGVRLPWGLIAAVKTECARRGVKMEAFVEAALRGALEGRSAGPVVAVETGIPAADVEQPAAPNDELRRLMAAGKITRGMPGRPMLAPLEDVWDDELEESESENEPEF